MTRAVADPQNIVRLAEQVVQRFMDECVGMPLVLVGARLGLMVSEALEQATSAKVYRLVAADVDHGPLDNVRKDVRGIAWFEDSPDAGHPACFCSSCGQLIEEASEGDRGGTVRMFSNGTPPLEARFHDTCFHTLVRTKVLAFGDSK